MKITLNHEYLSIKSFDECTLPDLVLIHGRNGSGKSHFLNAIHDGAISVYFQDRQLTATLVQDFQNFDFISHAEPESNISNAGIYNLVAEFRRSAALNKFLMKNSTPNQRWAFKGEEVDLFRIASSPPNKPGADEMETLSKEFIAGIQSSKDANLKSIASNLSPKSVLNYIGVLPKEVLVSQENSKKIRGNLTSPPIGRVFHRYIDLLKNEYRDQIKRGNSDDFIITDNIISKFGTPPWETYNARMRELGLEFEFLFKLTSNPIGWRIGIVKSGTEVDQSNLSTGERVMLNFALSSVAQNDITLETYRPDILLLDEPDAHLHPGLVKELLDKIIYPLISSGTRVIFTTHSPTTVSLVPDENIYQKVYSQGILPSTKNDAISELLVGVPHLAIDPSGRRQVITESKKDAEVYESIYNALLDQLPKSRSISFIGVDQSGTGGKDKVKSLTSHLRRSGVMSSFGLIDWDGKEMTTEEIHVHGAEKYKEIENIILNPFYLGLVLIKFKKIESLNHFKTTRLGTLLPNEIQNISNTIHDLIVPSMSGETTYIPMCGGGTLQISKSLLLMNGHRYEDLIHERIPQVKSFTTAGKSLMLHISQHILDELPQYIPTDYKQIFTSIMSH